MWRVSALYCRADSVYRDLLFDVWDIERDARLYAGPWPVVCHPSCRGWGTMRHFAKPRPGELELAFHAVDAVRRWGGVLEHPYGSSLWPAAGLPEPGEVDEYGGWSVTVDQGWWGHPAPKPTRLYVVGIPRHHFDVSPWLAAGGRASGRTLKLSPAERERTPYPFGEFLVRLAARCYVRPGRSVTPVDRARLPRPGGAGYVDLVAAVTQDQALRLPGGMGGTPMQSPRESDRPAAAMPALRGASRGLGAPGAARSAARPAKRVRDGWVQADFFADASAPAAPADEGPAQPA